MSNRDSSRLGTTIALAASSVFFSAVVRGQIVRDGTVGRGPAALPGPNFQISPRHGQQVGGNLFHSFHKFDLNNQQRATFTGPSSVRNILARVTGGAPSSIDGAIASSIPDVNLYLLNKDGVIFGPNAKLEISGSFAALSADSIGFGKSAGMFPGDPSARQVLSSEPPTSFGFLGPKSAGIEVKGARLEVNRGRELALIGSGTQRKGETAHGIVLRSGGTTDRFGRPRGAQLVAPDGRVDLVAVNAAGKIERSVINAVNGRQKTGSLDTASIATFGDISMAQRSQVNVDGAAAGSVFARGATMSIRDSIVSAVTTGDGRSSGVDLAMSDALSIIGAYAGGPGGVGGVGIFADTRSTGAAGRITLAAPTIRINPRTRTTRDANNILIQADDVDGVSTGSTRIVRDATGARLQAGAAGDIVINCNDLLLSRNGALRSESFGSDGDGGDIRIEATGLVQMNGAGGNFLTGISTRTFPSFTENTGNTLTQDNAGRGGDIAIAAEQLRMLNGARIVAETGQFRLPRAGGSGTGGSIRIEAGEIDIRGFKSNDPVVGSGIRSLAWQRTSGNAGDVSLIADRITVTDGGTVEADTRGRGAAGLISVDALELTITGLSPAIRDQPAATESASRISSQTTFSGADGGRGGSIIIATGALDVLDHGMIRVGSGTSATGTSGRIQINADTVRIASSGRIDSSTGTQSSGDGGEIRFGSSFRPVDELSVDAGSVLAVTQGSGDAGRITGSVGTLSVRNGGVMSTASLAEGTRSVPAGRAGAVTLSARSFIEIDSLSSIRTESINADAGGIRLVVRPDGAGIRIAGLVSTRAGGPGNPGGAIFVDAGPNLEVAASDPSAPSPTPESAQDDSFRGARLTARSAGDGGNIILTADDSIVLRKSLVSGNTGRFGGSISMSPQTVVIDSTIIDGRSSGTPVPVRIQSQVLLLSSNSRILSDAPAFSVNNDIAGTITAIDASVDDPMKRLIDTCARRYIYEQNAQTQVLATPASFSSFIVEGRGGVPLAPGNPLPAYPRVNYP